MKKVIKREIEVEMTEEFAKLLSGLDSDGGRSLKIILGLNNSITLDNVDQKPAQFYEIPRILTVMGYRWSSVEDLIWWVGQGNVVGPCGVHSYTLGGRRFSAYQKRGYVLLTVEKEGDYMGVGNPCEGCCFLCK